MKNFFYLPENGLFSGKRLASIWIPIMIEELMIVVISFINIGISVYIGEAAVGGISLITTINMLIKKLVLGLSVGGSIVISQYIGKNNIDMAEKVSKLLVINMVLLGIAVNAVVYFLKTPIVNWLAGTSEQAVKDAAMDFLKWSTFCIPFYGLYYSLTSICRSMCETRLTMIASSGMSFLDLGLKIIFVRKMNLGVTGAGLGTLFSVIISSLFLLLVLFFGKYKIRINRPSKITFDRSIVGKIYRLGIPNSIENGMFQLGLLLIQRLTASFGTYALSANAIAKALSGIAHIWSTASGLLLVTVVGQCIGYGDPAQAKTYIKFVMKANFVISGIIGILFLIFCKPIVSMYDVKPETINIATVILQIYLIGTITAYPFSFTLPQALRGAGDTKFTMEVSLFAMFAIRIGFAYLLAKGFNMGIYGVWTAMVVEWFFKGAIFFVRYKKDKWQSIKVV